MKKLLVLLLFLMAATGLMTTASISAQRNAWKKEAERAVKQREKIEEAYDLYQQETDEKLSSLATERDAYMLLTQAMEEENTRLNQELSGAQAALEETTARMEAEVIQAHADKAWAEQRLQEALDILSIPAPSQAPSSSPLPTEMPPAEKGEQGAAPAVDALAAAVKDFFTLTLPSPTPAPDAGPEETLIVPLDK